MRGFRFWNKIDKKMIYTEDAGSKDYPVLLAIGLHGLPIAIDKDSFRNEEIIGWNRDHNLIRMDSTGLKDKNGKEIYEGDIVELKAENGCCNMLGKIIYDVYDLAFELIDEEGNQEALWYTEQELEVIGNIYDNPELLKEE